MKHKEEIGRLVRQADFGRTENHDNQNLLIFGAILDGRMVVAPAKIKPTSKREFSLLEWVELVPTGREILTEEEHRGYVEKALVEGQPVPKNVLKDYPALQTA